MASGKISKPNMFRLVKKTVNLGSTSFAANETGTKEIPYSIDSGFTFYAVNRAFPTNAAITIGNNYETGTKFMIDYRNNTAQSVYSNIYVEYFEYQG